MAETEDEDIKVFEDAEIQIKNIIEGGKIDRFKFTHSESTALDFALRVIVANRQELQNED